MKTVPFNPKNKTHLKGFEKWVKKMNKYYKGNPTPTIVVNKKMLKDLKFIVTIKI